MYIKTFYKLFSLILFGNSCCIAIEIWPLWINTTAKAIESGIDVLRIEQDYCKTGELSETYFINYDNVEPIFGLEIAEELIKKYSFVAINFKNLCKEISKSHIETLKVQQTNFQLQQQNLPIVNEKPGSQQFPQVKLLPNNAPEYSFSGGVNDIESVAKLADINNAKANDGRKKYESVEEDLGDIVKLESDEGESRKLIEEKLGDELGKKVDVDRPVIVAESSSDEKENADERGPIGIDIKALDRLNIESLEKAMRGENDTEIDRILYVFEKIRANPEKQKLFASSHIIPLMKRVKYDPRTMPTLLEDQIVTVRVGLHVQSISNFQLTTMDYDMDLWLRMCWRDPRLAHGLSAPILITEESFLKRIWRPDAYFVNSVNSLFHRVTYLNFYMFVFAEGEVFFEVRLYLKPKSLFVLCKYPHDSQMLYLKMSSIAFTNNTVRFEWFSKREHAIFINRNVQLRELYITGWERTQCNSQRKTGNFTCLEAQFYMKRNLGYYLAQTYVPTATCVLFSWISVWLPEEFVEGRIFVALTVFLTLSAESNAAKEILPKVSYVKAIDIWFGFTALFVFATMLQALVVITLEHSSNKMKKIVEEKNDSLSVYKATKLLLKSKRYHQWGRGLDTFFKVMYPVILIIFLFIYIFAIIEGDEKKCLRGTEMEDWHSEEL